MKSQGLKMMLGGKNEINQDAIALSLGVSGVICTACLDPKTKASAGCTSFQSPLWSNNIYRLLLAPAPIGQGDARV